MSKWGNNNTNIISIEGLEWMATHWGSSDLNYPTQGNDTNPTRVLWHIAYWQVWHGVSLDFRNNKRDDHCNKSGYILRK